MVLLKHPVPGRPTNCHPTLVEEDYSNGFVCPSLSPSVDTILSPHLLLQFSRDLMELSSYCSHDLKMCIFYQGHALLIFTRPFLAL